MDAADVTRARGLARQARRTYPWVEHDLLEQAATIGVWKAARDFDPGTGVPRDYYLTLRARGEIADEVRRAAGGRRRRVPVVPWSDDIPGAAPDLETEDLLTWLRAAVGRIERPRWRDVLAARLAGATYKEIGEAFQVSPERVFAICRDATKDLRAREAREIARLREEISVA